MACEAEKGINLSSRGTLILSVTTAHGAYLCADSRRTNPQSNTAQKIFQCGDHAFIGLTGRLIERAEIRGFENRLMFSGVLNLMEILRDFSAHYTGDGIDLPERLGSRVYHILRPFWDLFVTFGQEGFFAGTKAGSYCEIPMVISGEKGPEPWMVRFPFSAEAGLLSPTKQTYNAINQIECWGQEVDTSGIKIDFESRESVLAGIADVYRRGVAVYPDTIGGPIDIGFIDTKGNGAKWIVRK